MKIKLVITAMLAILFSSLKAQDVILGEKKPCPGETYEYFFNGASCDGNLSWSLIDGVVMQQTSNSVKVRWNEGIVGNGRWKIRVIYNPRKSDGSCGTSTFYDLPIEVNAVSEFNIVGDREIPGGFRGVKTYTAQIKNSFFPASSYMWTVFSEGTATNYTTTLPSFNLNITNDGPKWISVRGKNSTCSSWGLSIKADIFTTTTFIGPDNLCSEATYTLINPGTVTLENAVGIATLTPLGNNQWKVTNNGLGGDVTLKSTNGSKSYTKKIRVGAYAKIVYNGGNSMPGGANAEIYADDVTGGTYTWSVVGGVIVSGKYSQTVIVRPNANPSNKVSNNFSVSLTYTNSCGTSYLNASYAIPPNSGTEIDYGE
ncbi:hypothetical protein [Sphingobacterium anhuiense]|uniref:Uncharacterized protein n=1 Tax=Sphingobacterium anhuiense TaxID=493780 RepID=A0ABW5YQN7_9SPHI